MKTKPKKTFKAVEFMRQRRDELSALCNSDPEKFWKLLLETHRKYRHKFRQKTRHAA